MNTIYAVVRRLLPHGTSGRRSWKAVPFWPPDLFAVAATLVNLSGCYAHTEYHCGFDECSFDAKYRQTVKDLGALLASSDIPPAVQEAWDRLLAARDPVVPLPDRKCGWWKDAMFLLAVADEACSGFGFASKRSSRLALLVFEAYRDWKAEKPRLLPYVPHSLCLGVPPDEACVQPKTRTPQIGCTLRSLSHNLALLPPVGEVRTYWDYAISHEDNSDEPLNVLLVPFPYRIRGSSFHAKPTQESAASIRSAMFELEQTWLEDVTSPEIATYIRDLIRLAKQEVSEVHAVVLPEAALTAEMAQDVAVILGKQANLELFVTGSIASQPAGPPRNLTYSAVFKRGKPVATWTQSKHHRWKLDESQISRYHLGDVLGKRKAWWESINVSDRECRFYVFRHGASLAVLVCEDLARIDPVQTVVRAVGPNLVIALLMDGPQLERRWPGRYATVLADDPGSAVLTLTSLGLIRRSNMPSEKGERKIALWKDALGSARDLELPEGCHSLLLTISPRKEENVTGDGRSDHKTTTTLSLTSVIGLKHATPPAWLHDV